MTEFFWQCAAWLAIAGLLVQVASVILVYWAKKAIAQLDITSAPFGTAAPTVVSPVSETL